MKISEEMLMAYVDRELDFEDVVAIERAARADPAIAQAIARARAVRERVRDHYADVAREKVPQRLLDAAEGHRRERSRRGRVPASASRGRWQQWTALAASLALGFLVSSWLRPVEKPQIRMAADGLRAEGELATALDGLLAPADRIAPGFSFVAKDDRYCRTFTLREPQNLAGLACRDADQWRIEVLAGTNGEGAGLRLASSALPPSVLAEVDERIAGEPLDAAGERRAHEAGWRR